MIKNITATQIKLKDIGIRLGAGQEYEVPVDRVGEFITSEDLTEEIQGGAIQVGNGTIYYTDVLEGECYFKTLFGDNSYVINGATLEQYSPEIVEDSNTGKKASSMFMNMLTIMRELYNATNDPLYDEDFTPILGELGWAEDHANRIDNLEVIHGKVGWHQREIVQAKYSRPRDLLIYYGWPNSFNSDTNSWDNELVAQEMASYGLVVLGDGIAAPAHGDYSNTTTIIPRVKTLNPECLIFGYVTANQDITDFQTAADQWDALAVDGVFMDECGYDYGLSREDFNTRVSYVKGLTYAKLCFVNSWNMDHIIGISDDPSYPNTTFNPTEVESLLEAEDWYLLESFAVNTLSYSGYLPAKSDWYVRGNKAILNRYTYGINIASVGIIDGALDPGDEQTALSNFAFISSLMWSLEANGTSNNYYGASTSSVRRYTKPSVTGLGSIYDLTPAINYDLNDSDIYIRLVDFGKLLLDFSTGAYDSSIVTY